MPSRPPKFRKTGVGEAPRVRRSEAAEKPLTHRCHACRQMRQDCVKAFHGRESEVYVCASCLEEHGQMRLGDEQ